MFLRFSFLLIAVLGVIAPDLRGEDKIWSAVVLASNATHPKDPPAQLVAISSRLKRVFGYNQFEILGSSTMSIEDQVERRLDPTEHFSLNIKARRASAKEARGGYLLNLELYHDKRQLVQSEAKLAPGSPLFFRGPLHASGQILIVLQIQ